MSNRVLYGSATILTGSSDDPRPQPSPRDRAAAERSELRDAIERSIADPDASTEELVELAEKRAEVDA